jgi:hypothetical protein
MYPCIKSIERKEYVHSVHPKEAAASNILGDANISQVNSKKMSRRTRG